MSLIREESKTKLSNCESSSILRNLKAPVTTKKPIKAEERDFFMTSAGLIDVSEDMSQQI
jgi:hypothetical protein